MPPGQTPTAIPPASQTPIATTDSLTEPPTELPAEPSATPSATAPISVPTEPVATVEVAPTGAGNLISPASGEAARAATAQELADSAPPLRDDVRLAVAYRGADPALSTPPPLADLQPGMIETFYVGNVDSNTVEEIEAELMSVGENAYFWFDLGEGSVDPNSSDLAAVTEAFDDIYDTLYTYFGVSEPAGGRVHIVHASPEALCDDADRCRLAGYYSSRDLLPRSVNPWSNERSMFVMNTRQFGGDSYLDVLSHELRHMLGASYDESDEDWFVEGAAMLAEELVGFVTLPQARGSLFLENPDQQLNSWTDSDTIPHYGQGYLVNRFLYDRLGESLFREFTFSREPGLAAVDAIAAANGLDLTGEGLWLDWLAAMALHGDPDVPEAYRWDGPELEPVATTPIDTLPETIETTVGQYAADYYELPSSGAVTIDFSGEPTVSLLGSAAPSGEHNWYAQRANYSNPRLTRVVDLRDVAAATLQYQVYADIEHGYDFAYVSVSTDVGETWQGLEAGGMQGLDPADDPSGSAMAARFYTGRTGQWIEETLDLTPYAGQEIVLRFEYVTDPILTYGGFAVDDIAIPEIGFFDDAETADIGWTAEGFTRATTALPQSWWLQLITFDADERPTVERLQVPADGRLEHIYRAVPGVRRPVLIVAATAAETLQTASYSLSIDEQ